MVSKKLEVFALTHSEGVFILRHPQASNPTIMSIRKFAELSKITDIDGFKHALNQALGSDRETFIRSYGDIDVYFSKAAECVSVYTMMGNPRIEL